MRNEPIRAIIRVNRETLERIAHNAVCERCQQPANARTRISGLWIGLSCCYRTVIVGRKLETESLSEGKHTGKKGE